jgi:hypothetical protein
MGHASARHACRVARRSGAATEVSQRCSIRRVAALLLV